MDKLNGYKTYIIAVLSIAGLWGGYLQGSLDLQSAINGTITALSAAAIRHGIKTDAKE